MDATAEMKRPPLVAPWIAGVLLVPTRWRYVSVQCCVGQAIIGLLGRWRVASQLVPGSDGPMVAQVAASLASIDRELAELLTVLVLAGSEGPGRGERVHRQTPLCANARNPARASPSHDGGRHGDPRRGLPFGAGLQPRGSCKAIQRAPVREVSGSNPVAPTIFRNEPFGENVEGLSHCGDQSYSSMSVFK
jgi:hypothetical protein